MRNQKDFWVEEFKNKTIFPGVHDMTPSTSLVDFEKYFPKPTNLSSVNIMDLGCGNGKNSFYLANKGYSVTAIDFAKNAISMARKNSQNKKIKFSVTDIGKPWRKIKTGEFDILLDMFTTICIPEKGRKNVITESLRVLKPGGLYFFTGVGRTSWCDSEPGPEKNSTIFSKTGKFEKQYSKGELLETFNNFKLIKYTERLANSKINNQLINFPILTALFQN